MFDVDLAWIVEAIRNWANLFIISFLSSARSCECIVHLGLITVSSYFNWDWIDFFIEIAQICSALNIWDLLRSILQKSDMYIETVLPGVIVTWKFVVPRYVQICQVCPFWVLLRAVWYVIASGWGQPGV